jgi:hypothetical protein
MTPSVVLGLVAQYGPQVVGLVGQLIALRQAGDKPLTAEDFVRLNELASKSSADYLAAAQAEAEKSRNT